MLKRLRVKYSLISILFLSLSCKVTPPVPMQQTVRSGVWVHDFYEEGDSDWSNAIKRAQDFAKKSGNRSILFENNVYHISKQITIDKDIDLIGSSMNKTIIRSTKGGHYPDAIIKFTGANVLKINTKLKNKITKYDRELIFKTTPNIKQGDVLVIESKIQDSWQKGFVKGEYVKVQEVINNKILLFGQVHDDYSLSEINIYKYDGTKSSIKNLTVIGQPTELKACIMLERGLNNNIENIVVKGSDYAGIITVMGYNQSFINIRAEKTTNDNGNGLSYGINIGNSQQVKLINCNLYGVRHALTFGGAGTIKIPNRFNTCMNTTLASRINYAASFHPNSESCAYVNCDIFGGVGIRGRNHKISNCNIYNLFDEQVHTHMHNITFYENIIDFNHEIINNTFYTRKKTAELAINYQDADSPKFRGGILKISGNRFNIYCDLENKKGQPIINFNLNNSDSFSKIIFNDNIINSSSDHLLFQCRSFSKTNFNKLTLKDNEFGKTGIFIQNVNSLQINRNVLEGHYTYGIHIQQLLSNQGLNETSVIEGNSISGCGHQALIYERFRKSSHRLILKNNIITNNLCSSRSNIKNSSNVSITNVETCFVQNNIIGSDTNNNQKKKGVFKGIDRFSSGNNVWLGTGNLVIESKELESLK